VNYSAAADTYALSANYDEAVALNEAGGNTDYLTNGIGAINWNTADWSVSLWAYRTVMNDSEYLLTLLNAGASDWVLNTEVLADGAQNITVGGAGVGGVAGRWSIDTWNHVVISYSNAPQTFNAWHNGERIITNAACPSLAGFGTRFPFTIGSQANGLGGATTWEGYINELSVHQYAFTADDVAAVYNSGSGVVMGTNDYSCKQLLRFEGTLADSHPANNTPTGVGTPTYSAGNISSGYEARGVLQSIPWTSATSNNGATVEILLDESAFPPATNMWVDLSMDGGAVWSNVSSWTSLGTFAPSNTYYRYSAQQPFLLYSNRPTYRATWSNAENAKLKGVSHFVETVVE